MWYSNIEDFQKYIEPVIDNNTVTNMTVQLGGTAFLHCRVRNLGERTFLLSVLSTAKSTVLLDARRRARNKKRKRYSGACWCSIKKGSNSEGGD
ncbi:hypothetical protein V9T40_005977 [Parthenolecanium corni]|uniref:Uncharacterized protein n=1 Tax=Parthenolecanium corni TaxID=536013 RepID=A0AAN9YA34_9HEMI